MIFGRYKAVDRFIVKLPIIPRCFWFCLFWWLHRADFLCLCQPCSVLRFYSILWTLCCVGSFDWLHIYLPLCFLPLFIFLYPIQRLSSNMRLFLGLFVVRYFRFFNLYIFQAKFGYRNIMLFTGVSHFCRCCSFGCNFHGWFVCLVLCWLTHLKM